MAGPWDPAQRSTGVASGGGAGATHSLLAPGAADGHDLLAMEGELLLEALGWAGWLGHQGPGPEQGRSPSRCQPPSTRGNGAHFLKLRKL